MKVNLSESLRQKNPICQQVEIKQLKEKELCFECQEQVTCLYLAIKEGLDGFFAGLEISRDNQLVIDNLKDCGGLDKFELIHASRIISFLREIKGIYTKEDKEKASAEKEQQDEDEDEDEANYILKSIEPYSNLEVIKIKLRLFIEERILIVKNLLRISKY
jgi:hypothetical protein